MDPLLETRGLAKSYAAPVLVDINFDLQAGEIHALVGENGAGKSTLCNIVAGLRAADKGEMRLEGHPYAPVNKRTAGQPVFESSCRNSALSTTLPSPKIFFSITFRIALGGSAAPA